MAKGNSVIIIDANKLDFYKNFLDFLRPISPINKLRNKQLLILAALLYKRNDISSKVVDAALIPKILFSTDVRDSIIKTCSISLMNYYGVIAVFKKLGIIVNGDISKKVIPELENDKFTLVIAFNIKDE